VWCHDVERCGLGPQLRLNIINLVALYSMMLSERREGEESSIYLLPSENRIKF